MQQSGQPDNPRRSFRPTTAPWRTQADATDTTVPLDRGYDSGVPRVLLTNLALAGTIARKGEFAPLQAGTRWAIERTHAWMNRYGTLRRCTKRTGRVVHLYLLLAAARATAGPVVPPGGDSPNAYCRYVGLLFRLLISTTPMPCSNVGSINTTHER